MTSIFHLDQSNKAPRDIRLPLDERPANGGHWREMRWSSGDMEQLQAELTRREGDLHIAAEIGTTLLEKMRTLEEENERLQSECTQFFEVRWLLLVCMQQKREKGVLRTCMGVVCKR